MKKLKFLKNRIRFPSKNRLLITTFAAATAILGLSFYLNITRGPLSSQDLAGYAQQIVEDCSSEPYPPTCYEEEVPKLMDFLSMEDAFQVTALIQGEDRSFVYCHVLGHKLSAREVDKDPSKWKDTVSRCPSGLCSNGCIHGGFQQRFRAEYFTDDEIRAILPDLKAICEPRDNWKPTGLEQASCYHAVGHLTMYLTRADIAKSTSLCEEITSGSKTGNYDHLCFDGAFMQIFQPLEPEDFALIAGKELKKEEVEGFCSKFTGEKRGSCWTESWPLFLAELSSPQGLVDFCAKADEAERDRCFLSIEYVLTARTNFDLEKIKSYCSGLPLERSGKCFAHAASRMVETDYRNSQKSIDLCGIAAPFDPKSDCYEELVFYASYNFHSGSEEQQVVCRGLPEPWREKCFSKTKQS